MRTAVSCCMALVASAAAHAVGPNFAADVRIQNVNPDLILEDTDGETWALEVDEPVARAFAVSHGNGNVHSLVIEDGAPQGSLYIDDTGRVGLGTTAPFSPLHVFAPVPEIILETFAGGWSISASADDLCLGSCVQGSSFIQINSPTVGGSVVLSNAAQPSSRASKADIRAVDTASVLAKLQELPIVEWRYRTEQEGTRHLGPVAEDFRAAFGLGTDGANIGLLDAAGVALAAVQGLKADQESQIARLTAELAELRRELQTVATAASVRCKHRGATADGSGAQREVRR